jgi:hypothetical protein
VEVTSSSLVPPIRREPLTSFVRGSFALTSEALTTLSRGCSSKARPTKAGGYDERMFGLGPIEPLIFAVIVYLSAQGVVAVVKKRAR